MKGKTRNKLLAIVAVLILAILVAVPVINALPTRAANYADSVAGPSVTFTKYLVIPNNLTIPAKTFEFTVTPGAAVTGTTSKMPVYAGDDSGKTGGAPTALNPIEVQAAFAAGASTTAGTATDNIANDTEKKYASVDVTINLSGVTYKEPGIYRYVVTEDTSGTDVTYDPQSVRTLDILIIDNNGVLAYDSAVMYYGVPDDTVDASTVKLAGDGNIEQGNKCFSYVNEYPSHNLYVGKKVTGNQGSKDKYFRFAITITNPGKNSTIRVGGDYDVTVANNVNGATELDSNDPLNTSDEYENPTVLTSNANGDDIVAVFYLQSDQYVNLMGIPTGATYEVAEANYSADGYTSTATSSTESFTITDSTNNATLTFDDPVSGTIGTEDIYTGYTNNKQGLIPTGVVLSVVPWVIAGVVIIGGVVFFAIRSKKKYDEQ